MLKKYTIKDIAEMAGVSKGTVDRVIHKRGKVSKNALENVNKILEKIDYQPNLIARNLKNNKIYQIAVLIPDPKIDPYWNPCIDGINKAVEELKNFGANIDTIFFDPKDTKSFSQANNAILDLSPDALVMVPLFKKESLSVLREYEKKGVVVSTFNNYIDSTIINNFVGQDLYQSGRVAAKLMHSIMDEGDIAIVHIDEKYKNAIYMQDKEKGFKSYFKDIISFKNNITTWNLKHPEFESQFSIFLNNNKNLRGLFVTTSKTYQVAKIVKQKSLSNISIVGYDLLDENVMYLKDGTIDYLIHQNPKHQAYLALKKIIDFLLFEKKTTKQTLLPIDIINSENVGPFMRH